MKYVLAVLLCVVSIIGGIVIGMRINTKTQVVTVAAPGTSASLIQCSDIVPAMILKNLNGTIASVTNGTSTVSMKLSSGKIVSVLVDSKTVIQEQSPKDPATLKKDQSAFIAAQQKAKKAVGTSTQALQPPLPFTVTNLTFLNLEEGMSIKVLSDSSVIGKSSIRAVSIIVATTTSTSSNAY